MRPVSAATAALSLLPLALLVCAPLRAQSSPVNPLKLAPHHATASVADLDRESAWYQQVLGFQELARLQDGPDFAMRQLGIPGYRIDLVWRRGSVRPAVASGTAGQGWLHVVFRTPDIDAALQRLTALGADVQVSRNEQHAVTRLTFHDPEGNELEIVRP